MGVDLNEPPFVDVRSAVQYTSVQVPGRGCQGRLVSKLGAAPRQARGERIGNQERPMPVGPEKEKAIDLAVSSIEKAFG